MPSPAQLSHALRQDESDVMRLRRWVIGLSLFGAAMGQLIGAYQTGLIKRLPDPKEGVFNATKVDASDYAYKRFDTPDGLLLHRKPELCSGWFDAIEVKIWRAFRAANRYPLRLKAR